LIGQTIKITGGPYKGNCSCSLCCMHYDTYFEMSFVIYVAANMFHLSVGTAVYISPLSQPLIYKQLKTQVLLLKSVHILKLYLLHVSTIYSVQILKTQLTSLDCLLQWIHC
jgi:hypothetical protein